MFKQLKLLSILVMVSLSLTKSTIVEDNIRNLLEELRLRMHMDMTDTIGIPRLEPFFLEYFKLDNLSEDLSGMDAFIYDVYMSGFKQFIMNDLKFSVNTFSFEFDISVPIINVTGYYDADGMLAGIFPFKGSGPYNTEIFNANIKTNGYLNYVALTETWSMSEIHIGCSIEKINVNFQGIEATQNVQDFLNEAMSALGSEILTEIWPDMEPFIVEMVIEMSNENMNGLNILSIINGDGDIFPPIEPIP